MTLLVKRDDNPMKVLRECYVVSITYLSIAGAGHIADEGRGRAKIWPVCRLAARMACQIGAGAGKMRPLATPCVRHRSPLAPPQASARSP